MQMELIQFIKARVNGKVQRVGVLYAKGRPPREQGQSNLIFIGWSRANIKKGDNFDPARALAIAQCRSCAHSDASLPPVPCSMKHAMDLFKDRCLRYFKGYELYLK